MYRRVAVVTDSMACLPPELATRLGVTVVQLQLNLGQQQSDEGYVPPEDVVRAMRERVPVSTSPPPTAAFFWAYQDAAARGAEAVVSVHVSSVLSETCAAAADAATQARIPVHILDSRTCGMTIGYAAIAAAEAAISGGNVTQVRDIARYRCQTGSELIYVDTLEYLHRGGRIGSAAKWFGTAFSIKPLLTIRDGQVTPLEKVRGAERAITRMVDLAAERAGERPVDIAVEHFGAADHAAVLLERLRGRIRYGREFLLTSVSAAVGAHVGPGSLGICISPC